MKHCTYYILYKLEISNLDSEREIWEAPLPPIGLIVSSWEGMRGIKSPWSSHPCRPGHPSRGWCGEAAGARPSWSGPVIWQTKHRAKKKRPTPTQTNSSTDKVTVDLMKGYWIFSSATEWSVNWESDNHTFFVKHNEIFKKKCGGLSLCLHPVKIEYSLAKFLPESPPPSTGGLQLRLLPPGSRALFRPSVCKC